jgi:PAS domain S-box-containing protein
MVHHVSIKLSDHLYSDIRRCVFREDWLMDAKSTTDELKRQIDSLQKENLRHRKRGAALWEMQERLSQILDNISIPTFVIDNQHKITHYNKAMEALTGVAAEEIIGSNRQWEVFYSAERPTMADFIVDRASNETIEKYYKDKYRKSLVKEGAYEAEGFFPEIGENGKWLFFTAAPLTGGDGNVLGAVETLQDVTERKQAEEELIKSERRFRTLLDFAPYAVVVFDMEGYVTYLNSAFTETFGWTFAELKGRRIPYVPEELRKEIPKDVERLVKEKVIQRHETRRLTKNGRLLDVVIKASVFFDSRGEPAGELVIIRDVTLEKRIARNNEAMLRISMALPEYFELYELFDYVSSVIKDLIGTQGGVALLLDEIHQELYFMGVAFEDKATEERVKEVRFGLDELLAGRVIKTGKPMIVNDLPEDSEIHKERDRRLGYKTKNLILVPLRSQDRVIGVLCAINKKTGDFDESDVELLSMLAGTVVLSIENARFAEEVKKAYMEVSSLNRAKDKVINLLSHELRTPLAVLDSSLVAMEKKLEGLEDDNWQPTMERARRNLKRLLEMQYRVSDIMQEKTFQSYDILSRLVEHCADELEALVVEETGEGPVIERIRKRIKEDFGFKDISPEPIQLDDFIKQRMTELASRFEHRQVEVITRFNPAPKIYLPSDSLQKIFDGLVKNAIENTPDEGRIEISVHAHEQGTMLEVRDFGVGITEENQSRIFEGFYATQDTMDYSSKRPFDFNAGGKGMDLLRMKIFSERFKFKIRMSSARCPQIPADSDTCPGKISECPLCQKGQGCHHSPATTFTLYFPPAP